MVLVIAAHAALLDLFSGFCRMLSVILFQGPAEFSEPDHSLAMRATGRLQGRARNQASSYFVLKFVCLFSIFAAQCNLSFRMNGVALAWKQILARE